MKREIVSDLLNEKLIHYKHRYGLNVYILPKSPIKNSLQSMLLIMAQMIMSLLYPVKSSQ